MKLSVQILAIGGCTITACYYSRSLMLLVGKNIKKEKTLYFVQHEHYENTHTDTEIHSNGKMAQQKGRKGKKENYKI